MFSRKSLSHQELRIRLDELEIVPQVPSTLSSRKRGLLLALTVAMVLVAGTGWTMSRFAATPTEVVIPTVVETTVASDWASVLAAIDESRLRAFETRDPNVLAVAVDEDGPAYARDAEVIRTMLDQGIEILDVRVTVTSATFRFRRWSGHREFVSINVSDIRHAYTQVSESGLRQRIPQRSPRSWNVTLSRAAGDEPWRLWNVESASDFAGEDLSR